MAAAAACLLAAAALTLGPPVSYGVMESRTATLAICFHCVSCHGLKQHAAGMRTPGHAHLSRAFNNHQV